MSGYVCFGGPLDGQHHDFAVTSFPYPRGWYYLVLAPKGGAHWLWRDQPGTFTDRDLNWCREHGLLSPDGTERMA